jgi:excisionase family DNA binding protein
MTKMMTYNEISKMLGITKGTLYSMVSRNRIPYTRLGARTVRFPEDKIQEWIKRGSVEPQMSTQLTVYERKAVEPDPLFEPCTTRAIAALPKRKEISPLGNPHILESLDEWELSRRSHECLRDANIEFVADLIQLSEGQLLSIHRIGRKSVKEIKEILNALGLSLNMNVKGWGKIRDSLIDIPLEHRRWLLRKVIPARD